MENLQRKGIRPDEKSAVEFLTEYLDLFKQGGQARIHRSLVDHLIRTGQASNDQDAITKLRRHRNEMTIRHGSLEFSREINLPFYDPDPRRVLPFWIAGASARLENARVFGQDAERVEPLTTQMQEAGGDVEAVTAIMKRILGHLDGVPGGQKIPQLIRMLQGFKLGLAAVPNATQGSLNSLLFSDLRSTMHGFQAMFTQAGKRLAQQSGANIESVLNEMVREAGGDTRALGTFLKATGFVATERMNRTLSANAGAHYAGRMARRLAKNPSDIRANRALRELGIEPAGVTGGKLTPGQVLQAAKKFSDITQFRARPSDLPFFASSPWGKVFFQFKTFIYNQTKFVGRNTIDLVKAPGQREWRRAARNLILLGSVFPAVGELIAAARSALTGRERDDEGTLRFFNDLASVGAAGLLLEAVQAGKFRGGISFLVGPSVSDAGELVDLFGGIAAEGLDPSSSQDAQKAAEKIWKFAFRRIPLVGQVAFRRVYPLRKAKKQNLVGF